MGTEARVTILIPTTISIEAVIGPSTALLESAHATKTVTASIYLLSGKRGDAVMIKQLSHRMFAYRGVLVELILGLLSTKSNVQKDILSSLSFQTRQLRMGLLLALICVPLISQLRAQNRQARKMAGTESAKITASWFGSPLASWNNYGL